MLTRYTVTVIETLSDQEGNSHTEEKAYFSEMRHGYLRSSEIPRTVFFTADEAEEMIETLSLDTSRSNGLSGPVSLCGTYNKKYEYAVEAINYTYANHHGYSDSNPFEIVRVVSDKTIELRSMIWERASDWKPEFVSGGFVAHCTNNGDQRNAWIIKSDPDGYTIRARLQKNGSWKSSHGRHSLHTAAIKHYDYNF